MTDAESGVTIQRGRTYRAKNPRHVEGLVNDRTVIFISQIGGYVQYDGPAVDLGRKYPRVTIEAFKKWVGEDVTEKIPKNEYQRWSDYLKSKVKND